MLWRRFLYILPFYSQHAPSVLYCIFHIYADSEPEDTEITQPTDQHLQLHDEGTKLKYIVHASSIVG